MRSLPEIPAARRLGRRRRRAAAFAVALFSASAAGVARGGDGDLVYDWKVDGAVTAGALAFWGGTQLFEGSLAPAACRWCNPGALDGAVRGALRWDDTAAANTVSNLGAYAVVPLASLGLLAAGAHFEGRFGEMAGNVLVIAESVALAESANQIVKFAVGRERPFVHALPPAEKSLTGNPADNNVSFYSAHASFAFALAVSTGTVASMRRYRWAPAIWAAGLVGAAAVGYLRIAADRHYFTDVVTGAVAGGAFGFMVPYEFHRAPAALTLVPAPGGGALLVLSTRL